MILDPKKTYVNKTWKYLIPCLYSYEEEFMDLFNRTFTIACGIHDTHLKRNTITKRKVVYVLFNSDFNQDIIRRLIKVSEKLNILAYNYEVGFPLVESKQLMLVFHIPKEHHKGYEKFLIGEYSKMYSEEFIEKTWKNKESKLVLKKDKAGVPALLTEIKKVLGYNFPSHELEKPELALPLIKEEEIFNCVGEQTVFFNENLDKLWHKN